MYIRNLGPQGDVTVCQITLVSKAHSPDLQLSLSPRVLVYSQCVRLAHMERTGVEVPRHHVNRAG
eukprot:6202491-Pleurochrysis_carterae.AAC.3